MNSGFGFYHLAVHLADEFPRLDSAIISRSLLAAVEQVGDVSRELILKRAREILAGDGHPNGHADPSAAP